MAYYKYTLGKNNEILKDGHTMFPQDVVKDLNRKSYLEARQDIITEGLGMLDEMMVKGHGIDRSSNITYLTFNHGFLAPPDFMTAPNLAQLLDKLIQGGKIDG